MWIPENGKIIAASADGRQHMDTDQQSLQDREKKGKMKKAARRRQEELNEEFQRMKEEAATCDPLVAQKALAQINAMLADVPAS